MMTLETVTEISNEVFGDLIPESIFVEYNGPRIFSFRDTNKRLLFAYLCDDGNDFSRFTVVPTSESQIQKLLNGDLTLVQALSQPWGWVMDINHDGHVVRVFEGDPTTLPSAYRPAHNAYLPGAKKYDFSIRLLGPLMSEESAPLSSMKYASERTMATVQSLAKYVVARNDLKHFGDKQARELADLPVCGMLLASLEVDVKLPKAKENTADPMAKESNFVIEEVEKLLNKAIAWAADPALMDAPENDAEESVAVLNAIEKLTPTGRNNVHEVQLGGRLVTSQRKRTVSLNKDLRVNIRKSMKRNMSKLGTSMPRSIQWPEVVTAVGRVTNADTTLHTFLLREIGSVFIAEEDEEVMEDGWAFGEFMRFAYDEIKWREKVISSLDTSVLVKVVGKLTRQSDLPEGTVLVYATPQYQLLDLEIEPKV